MTSLLLPILSLIMLVMGLLFAILKFLAMNLSNNNIKSLFENRKSLFYNIHVTGSKFTVILAFIHGFIMTSETQNNSFTGWLLGFNLVILLLIGAILSIKHNSIPMTEDQDRQWRVVRIVKWILTFTVIVFLFLHLYF